MLADARTKRGLELSELADLIGVTKPQVWSWENGKYCPRRKYLLRLSKHLHIKYDTLVDAVATARYR